MAFVSVHGSLLGKLILYMLIFWVVDRYHTIYCVRSKQYSGYTDPHTHIDIDRITI